MQSPHEKILECKDLRISFNTLSGTVKAVRGISFTLYKGKTLAIVGESGSGKSVTSRAILGILANNKIVEGGQILYDGKDLLQLSEEQFTSIRGSKISMIFQDPLSSLNPIMRVGKQLTEPMFLKAKATRKEAKLAFKVYKNNLSSDLKDFLDVSNFFDLVKNYAKLDSINYLIEKNKNTVSSIEEQIKSKSDKKLLAKKENLLSEINRLESEISNSKTSLDNFFLNDENQKNIKNALSSKYNVYIETLKDLKQSLIEFKEKYFITSFDYKQAILDKLATIENLYSERLKKINKIQKEIIEETNKDIPESETKIGRENTRLNELKKEKITINNEYSLRIDALRKEIKQVIVFDAKGAFADIKLIQKKINQCNYVYSVEKDDIVSVFATSFKRYIFEYLQSIRLNSEEIHFKEKFFDFENGTKKEIPAKLRAKRRETIVPFYTFYETMIKSIENIVSYIESELLSKTFDVDVYYSLFIENFKKQVLLASTKVKKSEAKKKALELLKEVGIPEPERRYYQYPFEFSGGMRQRIVIAIALSSNPEILICDEPTTALDVTIQAQILELINKMKEEHNLSIIFITHDLGVVANMADDIAVMYAGKIVEYGSVYDIFYDPRHPYTWALLGSMPDLDTKDKLEAIPGTPPNMLLPPKGDAFAARNKYAMKIDYESQPPFFKVSESHSAATWLLHDNAPDVKAPKVVRERILNSLRSNSNNEPEYINEKNSILKGGK